MPCEEEEGGHCEGTEGECDDVGLAEISVYLRSTQRNGLFLATLTLNVGLSIFESCVQWSEVLIFIHLLFW